MHRSSLYFTGPRQAAIRQEPLPPLAPGRVLVQTRLSAISPGSELLVYRGQLPAEEAVDESLPALAGQTGYPLRYGYSAAGQVIATGDGVDPSWKGRLVFAFQPHQSHFQAEPRDLIPLPEDLPIEEAVFLPNMETAINFVMDGRPLIGENVVVFGQGIVGLLAAALMSRFPLAHLISLDRYPLRRQASIALGVQASLDPASPEASEEVLHLLPDGADLSFELSGAPEALDQAIAVTGFAGRVVIGSWYGGKRASLDLGGGFHRSRIHLISSQVSSLSPELTGRWTKNRRFQLAWEMLRAVRPSRWITHRIPFSESPQAYKILDEKTETAIQVVLDYE